LRHARRERCAHGQTRQREHLVSIDGLLRPEYEPRAHPRREVELIEERREVKFHRVSGALRARASLEPRRVVHLVHLLARACLVDDGFRDDAQAFLGVLR
jgi:hypothetical protein